MSGLSRASGWAALLMMYAVGAKAEATSVSIGETYGLTHLASYVLVDQRFIEKEAATRGLGPVRVEFKQVGNGNVVADLLLSGGVNVAMTGVVPFLSLWNKVKSIKPIKGIASLSESNIFLMTTDPAIRSIADYKSDDRIAMTDVSTTTWSLLLQMEAAKQWGWEDRNRFESMSVPMANGEATASMMSGRTEVKSHMTMLPYSALERASGHVRPILSSKDVTGGLISAAMSFTTVKFHDENPKLYQAIAAAFEDADAFIAANPRAAAEIYNRHEPQRSGVVGILKMMDSSQPDELKYTTTPNGIKAFADFMAKEGMIKQSEPSWKDFFFENMADKPGS